MAEDVLWKREPGCVCDAELLTAEDGDLMLERRVRPGCPIHRKMGDRFDEAMARAVEVAQGIPGLREIDPARLRRLLKEIAPALLAAASSPPDQPVAPSRKE